MYKLDKEWWLKDKPNHVFDPDWFKAFEAIDPRLTLNSSSQAGKMGVVLWHEDDGETIIPAGITYRDGDEFIFLYHPDYVNDPNTKPISQSLPKTTKPYKYTDEYSLLPFFDNLLAEGILGMAQHNASISFDPTLAGSTEEERIKIQKERSFDKLENFESEDDSESRYRRLLSFGRGFHGAVSVVDAMISDEILTLEDNELQHYLASRSTIGGQQPKTLLTKSGDGFVATTGNETSTHIAKFEGDHKDSIIYPEEPTNIVKNEYLNIVATHALLPDDETVEASIMEKTEAIEGIEGLVLLIKRFDRSSNGGRKHFEEASQIKGINSEAKYNFSYKDLADVTRDVAGQEEVKKLYKRLLAQFILGNADNHFKNFGFWDDNGKWKLVPNYDLVSTDRLKRQGEFLDNMALSIDGKTYDLLKMTRETLVALGKEFQLSDDEINTTIEELGSQINAAKEAIMKDSSPQISSEQKERFNELIDLRFNLLTDPDRKQGPRQFPRNEGGWGIGR